jgi:peptidyl-tRNA hydrolase
VDDALVQYYVSPAGVHADGALALLAARAALLGQARWSGRAEYRRWRTVMMTKVVLEASASDFERARKLPDALTMHADGREATCDEPGTLLVLPPQPRATVESPLGMLRLARKRRGRAPEPAVGPTLVLVAADDLGMHGGKLAAQAAHAALLAEGAAAHRPTWVAWEQAGAPLALRRATSTVLALLAARYPGGTVHDAGFTQVASGSLTVVAVSPGAEEGSQLLRDLSPW